MKSAWLLSVALLSFLDATAQTNNYTVTNIIDSSQDAFLINPWGLSRPTSPRLAETEWWVADNKTGLSTLYYANALGPDSLANLVVTIPSAAAGGIGSPTGTAYYGGTNRRKPSSNFAFVTLDGTISNWDANEKPAVAGDSCAQCHVTKATVKVDNSALGAAYVGLTIAKNATSGKQTYYAANGHGGVEAYDAATFAALTLPAGAFTDTSIPNTYPLHGIQAIGANVFVAYRSSQHDGTGFVNEYDSTGKLKLRLQTGWFDQPWAIAMAPADFGPFSNMILVGNTGSGLIGAYVARTGKFVDFLRDASGQPIAIPGLWGLAFGSGSARSGPTNVLYFTGGGSSFSTGVFGAIKAN